MNFNNSNLFKTYCILFFIVCAIYFLSSLSSLKHESRTQTGNYAKESEQIIYSFFNSIKEEKFYSQFGEDGVLISLLTLLNMPKREGTFVEFGTQNASECNTRYLREAYEWKGLLMDGTYENLSINLHRENISYKNVRELFKKYNVDKKIRHIK